MINPILTLLTRFIERKQVVLTESQRKNPQIVHYYNEIVRFWNKLHFIIKKTIRSFKRVEIIDKGVMAKYLYSTYRMIWEGASIKSLVNELNLSKKSKICPFLKKIKTFSWQRALEGKSREEKLSIEEAIPTFVIKHLLPVISFDFLMKNVRFMNYLKLQDKCAVRISNLSSSLHDSDVIMKIKSNLKKKGIDIYNDQDILNLFHVPINKKKLILRNKWYLSGNLIFQDKASAAVVQVFDPKPNDFICDMCSGPGMKSSLIAQLTNNRATVIAAEFHPDRTMQTKKLLYRLNVLNNHLINTDSIKLPIRFESQFDKVLLDAPCTGSGSFLANPELKWRQNEQFLHQNVVLQKKLLTSAIKFLKPGGVLVYSTCSLYPEEGELQILDVITDLVPMKLPDWFSPSYEIDNFNIPGTGRVFPFTHQTQGFFIGKFKKKDE